MSSSLRYRISNASLLNSHITTTEHVVDAENAHVNTVNDTTSKWAERERERERNDPIYAAIIIIDTLLSLHYDIASPCWHISIRQPLVICHWYTLLSYATPLLILAWLSLRHIGHFWYEFAASEAPIILPLILAEDGHNMLRRAIAGEERCWPIHITTLHIAIAAINIIDIIVDEEHWWLLAITYFFAFRWVITTVIITALPLRYQRFVVYHWSLYNTCCH